MLGQGAKGISRRTRGWRQDDRGYAMVALLVGLSIMAVMLSMALPSWRTLAQREREAELVFRGQQYARAIALFQRRYANTFPPTVDVLVEQKFLRKKYLDPITGEEFQTIRVGQAQQGAPDNPAAAFTAGLGARGGAGRGGATQPAGLSATPLGGQAGIMGVTSKSDAQSLRVFNGRTKYNEWAFVAVQATTRAGGPNGGQNPNDSATGVRRGGPTTGQGTGRGGIGTRGGRF